MQKMLDAINNTRINPELLGHALTVHAELSTEEWHSFETRIIRTSALLRDLGLESQQSSLLIAIDFRLTALNRFLDYEGGGSGFRRQSSSAEEEWIHFDLLRCAAEAPLKSDSHERPCFDAEEFNCRLLMLAQPLGHA